jgi:arylsulfatase A-like enzyme
MNLLLITLDTTRADHISTLGGDPRNTPNIDALAARSTVFENAWSESNVTNPSHLTIMSGLHSIAHGILDNRTPVPEDLDTLPSALKRAGYQTAGFVSVQHLGRQMGWRDFDALPDIHPELKAERVTELALRWLRRRAEGRFFLWVHYFDPHAPYRPPSEIARLFYRGDPTRGEGPPIRSLSHYQKTQGRARWLGETRDPAFPRAMYAGEIHYMDRQIGRLLKALDGHGLAEHTVIVLVADHGESLDEHGIYLGHVGLYEPQLRIPLMIHVPGLAPLRTPLPATTLDIVPTLTALLGVEIRHATPGLPLLPLSPEGSSDALAARKIFIHQHAHNHAVSVRDGDWKLIWRVSQIHPVLTREPQLFHLAEDPSELHNLAASEPLRVAALRRMIEPWVARGMSRPGAATHLDEEALEQLRALGYSGE